MALRDKYRIKKISSNLANDMVVKNHYLHRKAQATFSFGLFEIGGDEFMGVVSDKLVGVIIYGSPASPNVCRGICGDDYFNDVIELTRLWIDDCVGKNGESFLIGNTIRLVNKKIIISYSEPDMGHIGIVYQASNFIYTGLTEKRTNRVAIDGSTIRHNRHECLKKDGTILIDRPRKHRYIYFNTDKRTKKQLMRKLKYIVLPYPKIMITDRKDV